MAIRDLVLLPDPLLRQVCPLVETIDDGIRTLARDMLDTMYNAPGIGLAAPQIGVPKRLIVLDVEERADNEAQVDHLAQPAPEPKPIVMVNPEIVASSHELALYQEGCLSIPDVFEDVERPATVRVRYTDLDSAEVEVDADGLLAVCVQHEIDHINGVLFIDHLSRLKRDRITRKFAKMAKQRERV